MVKIKTLASSLFISQDAFEKRFRKVIGITPKQFSFLIKMNAIVQEGRGTKHFTGLAFDWGYSDQPHFNKDFKLFTGQTPSEFFKAPALW